MKHSEGSSKSNKANLLFLIPLFAQVVASVFFTLALIRLNILQGWMLAAVLSILVIIVALNAFLFFGRNRGKVAKTIGVILSIIVVAGCLFGSKYARSATSFLSGITSEQYSVQVYEVRVLKKREFTKLEELSGQKIGFINTNPNLAETKAKLTESLPLYEAVEYTDVGSLIVGLYDQEISAVVVSLSYLGFLEETDLTFEEDTIVLHQMEVVSKNKPDLRQPVDIVKEPFIVYISGSDSRGTINDVSDSDVNILAVVNPQQGKILLVNIPRDYEIQIYGTTGLTDKLKSAGLFGIETSKKTIEELLDVKINYVIKVGFQAVQQLVDAIGGVDVESDVDIVQKPRENSSRTCFINKGTNHLDGECALAFSRHRKTLKEGDLDRSVHQQVVLTAIIDKISDIHNVTRLPQILNAAKDTFQTSLTEKEITDFVRWQLGELTHWKIESIQIGTSEHVLKPTYTITTQNMWLYLRDEKTETLAKQKIAEYLGQASTTNSTEPSEETSRETPGEEAGEFAEDNTAAPTMDNPEEALE